MNYEIVSTKYEIPFYVFQNEAHKSKGYDFDRYYLVNVNEYEINYIMDIITNQISSCQNATPRMVNEICDYSVQIAGIYDSYNKTKLIYLNFHFGYFDFEEINKSDELNIGDLGKGTQFISVKDGGDTHFEAKINTSTNEFKVIFINGEA